MLRKAIAPSRRRSASPSRPSSRVATSSTYALRVRNPSCSSAAWATRSRCPVSPRTACCSARSRRIRRIMTTRPARAASARATAASATMPGVVVRSSTRRRIRPAQGGSQPPWRASAGEQDGVLLAVVVRRLLARHARDGDLDGGGLPDGRRLAERDGDARRLLRGRLRDRLVHGDGTARAAYGHAHPDVLLVVVALVGDGDDEGDAA